MAVYVDPIAAWGRSKTWKWDKSCHMFTDPGNEDELHALAKRIGLKRAWFQEREDLPHYDLTEGKRFQAVKAGAVEVTFQRMAAVMWRNRISRLRRVIARGVLTPEQTKMAKKLVRDLKARLKEVA